MRGGLLAMTVMASAAFAAQPVRLAMTPLHLVDVDASRGEYFAEHLANAMAGDALRVVTPRELATLLGLERQKQLLGCGGDSASCLAELGGAVGAEGIVLGDLAHLGKIWRADLKVIEPRSGAPLAVQSFKTEQEEELAELFEQAGRRLALAALVKLRAPAAPMTTARSLAWVPAIAAAATLGAGGVFWLSGRDAGSHLTSGEKWTTAEGLAWRNLANTRASISVGLLAAGSALALAALAMLVFGGE
jgi:hypothetical protein